MPQAMGPSAGVETELKLAFGPQAADGDVRAALGRLKAAGALGPYSLGPSRDVVMRDTYWDTDEDRLAAAGVSLRLRREGRERRLTLKTRGRQEDGLAQRLEWEADLDAASLAQGLAWLRERGLDPGSCALESFAASRPAGGLRPVLEVVSRRCRRPVALCGQPVAVLSLDRTDYPGRVGRPAGGLEVELSGEGTPAHLREIESLLEAVAPGLLQRDPMTKLERGLERPAL